MMMQHLGSFFLILFVALSASAQDTRTVDTRIADALALLPAKDSAIANIAYNELMSLDDDGLGKVLDGVRPNGDLSGVPYRYAVSLVAARAVKLVDRARIENALINALRRSKETEVRQYFISYLALIGTNRSASTLTALLSDQTLADPATGALLSISGGPFYPDLNQKAVLLGAVSVNATEEHLRIAQLQILVRKPASSQLLLQKELDRFDASYRRDVLNVAKYGLDNPVILEAWVKEYSKSKGERQADIFQMLASACQDDASVMQYVVPALDSKNASIRITALRALANTRKSAYAVDVARVILRPDPSKEERAEAEHAFLQLAGPSDVQTLGDQLAKAKPEAVFSILRILASRRYTKHFPAVQALTASPNSDIRSAAFEALPEVSSPGDVNRLLTMLPGLTVKDEITAVQQALIGISGPETAPQILSAVANQKLRLLPVLPYLRDTQSLSVVKSSFDQGRGEEKELAFDALTNWQSGDAVPILMSAVREPAGAYRTRAFAAFVKQVISTPMPSDQKLLKLREAYPLASSADERTLVLREAGSIRTFLAFVFVSSLLDDPELGATASRSAMRLALPTADGQAGMEGQEVRRALEKVMDRLTGPDSQYDRIDVQTYLDQLPYTQGYEPIFNGKDLTGWQGLVENPIARSKMTKEQLSAKQAASDARLSESWSVRDGMICFTGTGDNLCTKRLYGDFELIVDWRISRNGDSGIYLRGSPQVQIWDTSRVDVGAQVGSGGLYNNTVNRNPLVVADNPIGDWNTLRITMIGERVTVYLNGILVVDNVVMENYWDRKIPIFPEGPIELQAHGTELAFRNIYVKELNRPYQLSAEEKDQGFDLLFNSKDLSGWVGNKTDYVVDDQVIVIKPTGRGKGNLYTEKEYSDFVFRFEFQLTPAGNNGIGIHAPLEGDAAYVGKEIQILDDRHVAYKEIQPWQVHGSVYGIIAAKRDALRPTGQWNEEEVEVRGDRIKVTVNGVVIVDGDMKNASAKGTLDGKEHPGLKRHTGHIGFLGHGSVVRFRNIRIKDLLKK